MSSTHNSPDLATAIGEQLPFLRRYARALTGSQAEGDTHAAKTLEAILHDPSMFQTDVPAKQALFTIFHKEWNSVTSAETPDHGGIEAAARRHLSKLAPGSREALLLSVIEEFTPDQIAGIMALQTEDVHNLLAQAYDDMEKSIRGKVMIIEDEAIIAIDLEGIITDLGHAVTGVARTRDASVNLAGRTTPDLILSDIQLADNSSGIDAIDDIMKDLTVPVIFITAFPERLLSGEKHEPAFLISKPYTEEQVRVAVSQAMFFASTETLRA